MRAVLRNAWLAWGEDEKSSPTGDKRSWNTTPIWWHENPTKTLWLCSFVRSNYIGCTGLINYTKYSKVPQWCILNDTYFKCLKRCIMIGYSLHLYLVLNLIRILVMSSDRLFHESCHPLVARAFPYSRDICTPSSLIIHVKLPGFNIKTGCLRITKLCNMIPLTRSTVRFQHRWMDLVRFTVSPRRGILADRLAVRSHHLFRANYERGRDAAAAKGVSLKGYR